MKKETEGIKMHTPQMNWLHVVSSDIDSIGWDQKAKRLGILFKTTGMYIYRDVPRHVFIGLRNADSKGKYFHANIKNKYQFERLGTGFLTK